MDLIYFLKIENSFLLLFLKYVTIALFIVICNILLCHILTHY